MIELVEPQTLVNLFNIKTKKELKSYCQDAMILRQDFVSFILAAQAGVLSPYKYASHFEDKIPEHLTPKQEELAALGQATKGPLQGKAKKCVRKVFQLFVDRRHIAAHLFYTPSYDYWHLFYFDQRDQSTPKNHWRGGPHLHFVNDLWANLVLEDVWERVLRGDTSFSSVHIRYVGAESDNKPVHPTWQNSAPRG
jgi:hypothetical protein